MQASIVMQWDRFAYVHTIHAEMIPPHPIHPLCLEL